MISLNGVEKLAAETAADVGTVAFMLDSLVVGSMRLLGLDGIGPVTVVVSVVTSIVDLAALVVKTSMIV